MQKINFNKICELKNYKSCVYYIKNKTTNKLYIGSTTRTLDKRMYEHFSSKKSTELYNDFRLYGIDNFEIGILECNIPKEQLLEKERLYINKFNTKIVGYNTIDGNGLVGDLKQKRSTMCKTNNPNTMYKPESRKKLSKTLKSMDYNKGKNNPSAKQVKATNDIETLTFDTIKQGVEYILQTNDTVSGNNVRSMIGAITQVCKGKRKMAYGYRWEYI